MERTEASAASPRLLRLLAHPLAPVALLLGATAAALAWANSPWSGSYATLLATPLGVSLGGAALKKPLLLWINDGLMGVFFFLVGLEIKREVLVGELAKPRKAALAVAGALGGMVLPALLYVAVQRGGVAEHRAGWGVPMSTDIAFSLGVLALLRDRAPAALRVLLTALAIVDDIGAVLVIAVFYTDTVALASLVAGLGVFAVAVLANRLRVRNPLFYFLLGTLVWLAFLKSGVHATVAALLMAFVIPARTSIDTATLTRALDDDLTALRALPPTPGARLNDAARQRAIDAMGRNLKRAQAPLQTLEHQLEPVVKLLVLPIFALANAGVALDASALRSLAHPVAVGVLAGLVLGKPVGVVAVSWLAVRAGVAELPSGVRWRHVLGAGMLAGVGFTMALFIAGLAFEQRALLDVAKVGILAGSLASALLGVAVLRGGAAKEH